MDSFLPARFSLSPFFVRHVAKPRRMKHIEGLNGAPICAVNDDGFIPSNGGYENAFPPNNYMEAVLKSNENFKNFVGKRKEKAVAPTGQFQTYGLINDTQRWKIELDKLASSVGLMTQIDVEMNKTRKSHKNAAKDLRSQSPDKKPVSRNASRLNEPLKTGRKTSRGTPASRAASLATGKLNYLVDDRDREVWMLQVLCQILQTDNLTDVQSWLVSSDLTEKEQVKQLLDHAMKGLEESGRIQTDNVAKNATPMADANFQKFINDDKNIQLDNLKDTIDRINLKSPSKEVISKPATSKLSASVSRQNGSESVNILKLDDNEDDNRRSFKTPSAVLQKSNSKVAQSAAKNRPVSRSNINDTRLDSRNDNDFGSPLSPVFNINIYPKSAQAKEKPATASAAVESTKTASKGGFNINVEAPNKDMKIEEVKFTMYVKDDKTNTLQPIQGAWKPSDSVAKN